jgi:polar amino acid transport system substrate-binding protein
MQGVTIGATEGIFYEEDFRNAEEKGNVKVEWIPQDEMIIRMLLAGRIDVFVQDIYVGYSLLKKYLTPEERRLVTHSP